MSVTRHGSRFLSHTAQAAVTEPGPLTTFAPVVNRAMPAVVNISSSKVVKDRRQGGQGLFDDPFFRQFFGGRMPQQQQPRSQRATSLGSGVVVSPDGYILTNNHVVDGATDVKVSVRRQGRISGQDRRHRQIRRHRGPEDQQGPALTSLPFADSAKAQVGDVVLAMGEPFGLGQP